ncbi:MAG: phosphoribosylformylglycinamidine synthase subunit PurS [Actinomycetota bacterium]
MTIAKVYVTLKEGILDPQGQIIGKALKTQGYDNVSEVKVGKFIEMRLEGGDGPALKKQIDKISHELLSNPVIESYTFDILEEA